MRSAWNTFSAYLHTQHVPPQCFHHLLPPPWQSHITNTCTCYMHRIIHFTLSHPPSLSPIHTFPVSTHTHTHSTHSHGTCAVYTHNTDVHKYYKSNTARMYTMQAHSHTSLPWHDTPASSLCTQLLMPHPLKRHRSRDGSEPTQAT